MAELLFTIPLTNIPQRFNITLAGRELAFIVRWNDSPEEGWVLDVLNPDDDTPIVTNIPFVTGADLFAQYEYLGFNGKLIVATDGNLEAVPTLDNLGIEAQLYFLTEQ